MPLTSGDTLARVVMTAASGLPADAIVNTFSFRSTTPNNAAAAAAIFARLDDFYRFQAAGGGSSIGEFIGEDVTRAATHRMDFYTIVAGALGSPYASLPWLGPRAPANPNSNLPCEVAAVLSFKGDMTGVPEKSPVGAIPSTEYAIDQGAPATHQGITKLRARRRGRVFIGPLTTAAVSLNISQPPIAALFINALGAAAVKLEDSNVAALGGKWSVWSRRDSELYEVTDGWVDNAPDTMRKRGFKSTARTVWL